MLSLVQKGEQTSSLELIGLTCTTTSLLHDRVTIGSPMWYTSVSSDTTSIRVHSVCLTSTHMRVSVSSALLVYLGSGWGLVVLFTYQHVSLIISLCPPATYSV